MTSVSACGLGTINAGAPHVSYRGNIDAPWPTKYRLAFRGTYTLQALAYRESSDLVANIAQFRDGVGS